MRMEASKNLRYFSSVNLRILTPNSLPMFLIHLLAWPYGSMYRGHLWVLLVMIAFSMEKESLGRPWIVQLRI